ncbi:MAG: energy-coupling factor transporter transmembrane component T [Erysipelotrichia bacterium]|nr:energy-coupling factor transporter transmembrane component T [Erysipelotrichia bacterium]
MDHSAIINFIPGKTFLHKLTGESKVKLFVILIIYTIMSFDLPLLLPLFVLSIIALISLKPQWKSIKALILIVVLVNLLNIFLYWIADPLCGLEYTNDQTVLFAFTQRLVVTRGTLWYLIVRLLKMFTSFMVSLVFIMSITPSELAAGLYSLHLPYKFSSIVELAFRYIPDISRDYKNISTSMQCRGIEMDPKKVKLSVRLKQMVLILIPLIITSFDRIGNIANAMDLRGFGKSKKRTYYCEHEPTKYDRICKIIIYILFAFVVFYIVRKRVFPPITKMWIYWR